MFYPVYSISRHGLLKDITNFVFEWEASKNTGQPTRFFGFGKDGSDEYYVNVGKLFYRA
jgi:hypothetical protein